MLSTKHLSIMFTDMKGFTARASTQSRQQLHHLLELQDELIKPAIKQFDGTIVKTIGDAFLVTFESPTDAVLCGMKIQENILNHNARATSSDQIEVRIAINSGEVNLKDGDVFGEPVNIASRIEAIAEPNEVYFTEAVYLTMNKNEIPTAEVGYRKLKGIPEEIKAYKVVTEQTNLIRAKLKRQQMAEAHANLSKEEINIPVENQTPIEKNLGEKEPISLLPKQLRKTFWQKHKKKIIIIAIIFFLLLIIAKINENKQIKEAGLYPSQAQEIKNKLDIYKKDFAQALETSDQQKIKEILLGLQKLLNQQLPPVLKDPIISFLRNQLTNSNLSMENKKLLTNLLQEFKP
ncbi:MAG: adenylate/guanylate cyclase domain-containing protein [Patescibacteria group bacterium]